MYKMIQLFTNKLKIVTNLFLLVFFVTAIAVIVVPKNVLASTYGEGVYGACPYGQNGCNEDGSPVIPSPTPTTSKTDSNSSSSVSNGSSGKVAITNPTIPTPTFSIFDPSSNTDTSMLTDSTPTFTTQYPILHGHTLPFATVVIEIDGIPVEVIADTNGDWQYKVTSPLAFGKHTIKITIKEKDTGKIIAEGNYKIDIAKKTETQDNNSSPKNHKTLTIIGITALALSALIFLLIFLARRRRKKHRNY